MATPSSNGELETPLSQTERLFIPHRKRCTLSYKAHVDGHVELCIDYGAKEITFDEERLFPFGERLVREDVFTGEAATTWGPGYSWSELRPLLEVLLDEGVIRREGDVVSKGAEPTRGGLVPSPLPPAVTATYRVWNVKDCEAIARELVGSPFELGHIEAIVPVYRIAHPVLDMDHRQVGEANVFPRALRLDIETEWRVCQYPGSRYHDAAPMNVSGLKAMIRHWKPLMMTLSSVRSEMRERLGESSLNTIEGLYVLSGVVLGMLAYPLMRRGGVSPQPAIHPVLSSLFRITDGVRMTTTHMLFTVDAAREAVEVCSASSMYEYVERNLLLCGRTGVCAGPEALIREFLQHMVDGEQPQGLDDVELPSEVKELLAELPKAAEYALLGLMVESTSRLCWIAMSRAYQEVLAALDSGAEQFLGSAHLKTRLQREWQTLEQLQLTAERDRAVHEEAYRAAYELSWRALAKKVGASKLAEAVAPRFESSEDRVISDTIVACIASRSADGEAGDGLNASGRLRIAKAVVTLLRQEQAILSSASQLLREIEQLLVRPAARQTLGARHLRLFYAFYKRAEAFPYLFDTLSEVFGLRIEATEAVVSVAARGATDC